MEPIDYSFDVKSPIENAVAGLQTGLNIRNALSQQEQLELQRKLQLQMQTDLTALANNKGAGAQDYASMMVKYPQLSEHFKRSWDILNAEQQQNTLSDATQAYAALHGGKTDIAIKLLNDKATAYRNSGNTKEAGKLEALAKTIEFNPEAAKTSTALMLSSILGPEKFATTFSTLGDQTRAAEKAPADLRKTEAEADIKEAEAANAPTKLYLDNANTRSQIAERAGRLSLDQDKLTSEVQMKLAEMNPAFKLDEGAKKLVNESVIASVAADQAAGQSLTLADEFEKLGGGNGGFATIAEAWAKLSGSQDGMTKARQEYVRLRNSQAIKSLPPGPATDKDIELALKGFPPENANSKYISQFLRGMAKIQQYEAVANNAKAEWVNAVGHLGKAKADVEIDGVKVPAGSSFVDFTRQFMKQKTEQRAAEQAVQQVQGRSYMRHANPGAK